MWPNLSRAHPQSRLGPGNAANSQEKIFEDFSQVYEKIKTELESVSWLPLLPATSELSTFAGITWQD